MHLFSGYRSGSFPCFFLLRPFRLFREIAVGHRRRLKDRVAEQLDAPRKMHAAEAQGQQSGKRTGDQANEAAPLWGMDALGDMKNGDACHAPCCMLSFPTSCGGICRLAPSPCGQQGHGAPASMLPAHTEANAHDEDAGHPFAPLAVFAKQRTPTDAE